MWSFFAILGLIGLVIIAKTWGSSYLAERELASDSVSAISTEAAQKPFIGNETDNPRIRYELTRRDMIANQTSMIFRNKILRVFILLTLGFLEWMVLSTAHGASFLQILVAAMVVAMVFCVLLLLAFLLFMLAVAFFLKHRGVLGVHELEITDRGLLERTEFNENLVKWPGIARVRSNSSYLYISVSDLNFYSIPKRSVAPEQMAEFEQVLRARVSQVTAHAPARVAPAR